MKNDIPNGKENLICKVLSLLRNDHITKKSNKIKG